MLHRRTVTKYREEGMTVPPCIRPKEKAKTISCLS